MSMFKAMDLSASGLTAQRQRLDVIAENLANINTTRTAQGGPYKKKSVVLEATPQDDFDSYLGSPEQVEVVRVTSDPKAVRPELDPGHPDADKNGMVLYPDINPVTELVHLMLASRAYEANISVLRTGKAMAQKALDIVK